ncbi:hypothetical protein Sango_1986900 [Sesamum angolense]|uniref:Uncharacterized protein n=1 Tax=Sesamum angolense TaxID=2727404 RepID=A0AAE2BNM9_9LAMI|nr:hypothetical protein Sango_1986900 [Sesamum angolense]
MGNNPIEEDRNDEHVVKIWQVNEERLTRMQQKIADTPRILSRSAGKSSCCIFKVPQSLTDINGRCYQPHIVSVGPFHHGDPRLRMIEEHKWRFLGTLLKRTQAAKALSLEDFLQAVQPLEAEARECYSSIIHFSGDEFIEMLVLDGCFVIELFRKFGGVVPFEADDPLLSMSWVYSFFLRDLIRLENQIPFFVLQCLFDLTRMPGEESGPSLSNLTLSFFNNALQRSDEFVNKFQNPKPKHLLDLLRTSFIPDGYEEPTQSTYTNTHAGRYRNADDNNRRFHELVLAELRGVRAMPQGLLPMTTYATLLDCLINTAKDVEYLCDKNILENYFGTDGEVARFINNMGKDVSFDIDMCYLSELFNEVNHYYRNHWHVHWASFKYTYFKTPWSFISALAAFVLLVLTVAQTLFTIMAYVRPP